MATGVIHYAPNNKVSCGQRGGRGGMMSVTKAEAFRREIEQGSKPCAKCLAKAEAYQAKADAAAAR